MNFRFFTRRAVTGLLLASAVSLSACASDPLKDIPALEVETPALTLLEAGEGEKTAFNYATQSGEQQITVEVAHAVDQAAVAADKVSTEAPVGGDVAMLTLPLEVTVGEADGEGLSALDIVVGEPKHSDLDVGKEALTAEGFHARCMRNARGAISQIQLSPPDGSSDEGRATVESALLQLVSALPVFPDEPIGVGAVWDVRSRTMGEASMVRTTTYTLTSIDNGAPTLAVSVAEESHNKELDIDGNGEVLTATDTSTTTDPEARLHIDPSAPLPTGGRVASTTRIVYSGPNPNFKVVQDVTTATTYGK